MTWSAVLTMRLRHCANLVDRTVASIENFLVRAWLYLDHVLFLGA